MEDSVPDPPNSNYEGSVKEIVTRLRSHRKSVRDEAAVELASLGPQATEAILNAAKREKELWINTRILWGWGVWIVGMCLWELVRSGSKLPWLWFILKAVLFFASYAYVTKALIKWQASRLYAISRFVPSLCEIKDVRVLDLLINGYYMCDSKNRQKIEETIPSLVATNRQQAWDSLQPVTLTELYSLLYGGTVKLKNTSAIRAMLELFAECGGSKELRIVRKLAQHSKIEEVKETARQCASILSARLEAAVEAEALLRPASDVDEGQTKLVRAADAASTVAKDTLLRSDSTDASENVTTSLYSQN